MNTQHDDTMLSARKGGPMSDTHIGVSFKDRNHAIDALCRKVFGAEPSYGEDIQTTTKTPRTDAGWRVVEQRPGESAVETDTGVLVEVCGGKTVGEELDLLTRIARLPQLERDLALCQAGNRVYAEHNSKLTDERDCLTLQLAELREKCDALTALVGTTRGMLPIPVRSVSDLTPEEHSNEIGDAIAEIAKQQDALIAACQWAQAELGKHTRPSPIDTALAMVERREG
jgi:hypothetical protein